METPEETPEESPESSEIPEPQDEEESGKETKEDPLGDVFDETAEKDESNHSELWKSSYQFA